MSSKFIIDQLEWQSDRLQVSNAIMLRWERLYSWASLLIKGSKSNKNGMTRNQGLSTRHGKAERVQGFRKPSWVVWELTRLMAWAEYSALPWKAKVFGVFSHTSLLQGLHWMGPQTPVNSNALLLKIWHEFQRFLLGFWWVNLVFFPTWRVAFLQPTPASQGPPDGLSSSGWWVG